MKGSAIGWGIGFVSLFLFILGLIAPLTPSQELPSFAELFIFLGLPLLLLGSGIYLADMPWVRVVLSVEMVVILVLATVVLIPIYQTA